MNMTTIPADRPLAERITREPLAALERRCKRLNDDYAAARMTGRQDPAVGRRMHDKARAYSAAYLMVRAGEYPVPACD